MANEQTRVLFAAESVYQLFNAIILRLSECGSSVCDLVLSDVTPWKEETMARLRETGLFAEIYQPPVHEIEWEFWDKDLTFRRQRVKDPNLFFGDRFPCSSDYSVMFFPIDHIFWKMTYYRQAGTAHVPTVYMYDEGVRAYTMPLTMTDWNKPYLEGLQTQHPFVKAIERYYLHQPELYCINNAPWQRVKINLYGDAYEEIRKNIMYIYGVEALPDCPYIYLEDFFFADKYVSNDFELFEAIAAMVGKENIITKCHPRNKRNRFVEKGYQTVNMSAVPWEVQLLANNTDNKVFISVSSTSIFTPFMIFESGMHVISLEKMFVGYNPTHADEAYTAFVGKLLTMVNKNEIHIHRPQNMDELRETLRYIRSVVRAERSN